MASGTTGVVTGRIGGFKQAVTDFKLLIKLRLNLTVVLTSILAFLIALPGSINWLAVIILAAGGFFTTAAANALNQVLEKDFDAQMQRTADRPIAAGRMTISQAVMWAGFMTLFGISLLALFNPWTAFFGMVSLVLYAFVYTPLKRISPDAVIVGAIPGALPTLIGCIAAQGELTWLGLALFAIQFFWQLPHFWSIGYLGRLDYQKAGYKIVPTKADGSFDLRLLGVQAFVSCLVLVVLAMVPWQLGYVGLTSAILVSVLGLGFAYFAWRFWQEPIRKTALQLMFASFAYIPLALLFYLADKI